MEKGVLTVMKRSYELIRGNFSPADTVIVSAAIGFGARMAQDRDGYRVATVQLQPAAFRSVYANPKLPGMWMPRGMPRFIKRAIWGAADLAVVEPVLRGPVNAYRKELGLVPVKGILKGWWNSPELVLGLFPEWFAPVQPDWPKQVKLVGFPLFDERGLTPLPEELTEFLERHRGAIGFTAGSANVHARDFFAESIKACVKMGRAGLLLTRHGEQIPSNLPASVRHVPYAPFSELLPRCGALVHHGGIGTMAQSLAAGCPQMVVPLSHDQPDNGERAVKLGVAEVVKPKKYKAEKVAQSLERLVTSKEVAHACREVAGRFVGVDALGKACELIEGLGRTEFIHE
jgi:UDP:flavonoid glycosyltransferase YjiC (YdhE family)